MSRAATADQCVADVTHLLGAVGDAMASGDAEVLMALELRLGAAVASLVSAASVPEAADPHALVDAVHHAERALARCRTLGRVTTELISASLAAQGMAPGYQPAGTGAPLPRLGRVATRV